MSYSKVLILILNWNGWRDTIECLESVQRLDYPNYRVMVLDNQSSDQSINKIKEWAAGSLSCESNFLTYDAMRKPVKYIEYDRQTAEHGGVADQEALLDTLTPEKGMVLVHTGGNLGFAGGNNVGLRYALAKGEYEYVWLLNNDTVVMPDALDHMVERMIEEPKAGMCGSTLLYYHNPEIVQALGGAKYNRWFATSRHIGSCTVRTQAVDREAVEKQLDYVVGASLLVSAKMMFDIGIMNEEYFLYFEEIDWATRSKGNYSLLYAQDSIVFHKEGASIGSSNDPLQKSCLSDYYSLKNRLRFTKHYYPHLLPATYIGLLIALMNRMRRGQIDKAAMIIGIFGEA